MDAEVHHSDTLFEHGAHTRTARACVGRRDRDRSSALRDNLTLLIVAGNRINPFLLHYLTKPSPEPCWWLVLSPVVPWASTPPFTDEQTEVTRSSKQLPCSMPLVFFRCAGGRGGGAPWTLPQRR